MFAKLNAIVALLTSASSLVVASPAADIKDTRAERYVTFVNKIPTQEKIEYALVSSHGVVLSGSFKYGLSNIHFPLPPVGQGYSLKLAAQGHNPQASSNTLQLEYTLSNDGNLFYDWSAVNGPDPFSAYIRNIFPWSDKCLDIECREGQNDTKCEFTKDGPGPVGICPVTDGVDLSIEIS